MRLFWYGIDGILIMRWVVECDFEVFSIGVWGIGVVFCYERIDKEKRDLGEGVWFVSGWCGFVLEIKGNEF